jgi:hypothetical protein
MKRLLIAVPMALSLTLLTSPVWAKEVKLKVSAAKLKKACASAGGSWSGITGTGTYACDNSDNGGGVIACTKKGDCLGNVERVGATSSGKLSVRGILSKR